MASFHDAPRKFFTYVSIQSSAAHANNTSLCPSYVRCARVRPICPLSIPRCRFSVSRCSTSSLFSRFLAFSPQSASCLPCVSTTAAPHHLLQHRALASSLIANLLSANAVIGHSPPQPPMTWMGSGRQPPALATALVPNPPFSNPGTSPPPPLLPRPNPGTATSYEAETGRAAVSVVLVLLDLARAAGGKDGDCVACARDGYAVGPFRGETTRS